MKNATQTAIETTSYRQALHQVMRQALAEDARVILIGQGVDDHKGIFGSTTGLADEFGSHRVMDTPLAEEGIAGISLGAALNGLYPIQTHIRADFSLPAANQLINLAAKYKYMFGGRFEVPMLIRMAVGRSWGQGAQHSQSLQALFSHFPGLTVLMPSSAASVLAAYPYVIRNCKHPVISFEHRLLYDLNFRIGSQNDAAHPLSSRVVREGRDVTVVATSIMVLEAQRAADHMARIAGISTEIIDLHNISHPDSGLICESVRKTGRLLVADTSWRNYGVCAEVTRLVCENDPSSLKAPVATLGMAPTPCPTAKRLEDRFYPSLKDFADAIGRLVTGAANPGFALPDENSMADIYKRFKGPF